MESSLITSREDPFWSKDILKLLDKFKGMASVTASVGSSCLLWEDCWSGQPLRLTFPELHSFAKKPNISLVVAANVELAFNLFNLLAH